ncbi:MAG: signal peptidase II [Nanoarchaeota archaeon]|nr:signal peptidase II [Nanoarchaeota archaeon]MBU1854833.1 signal peptidase II [Nanoarchaeota archaeon]
MKRKILFGNLFKQRNVLIFLCLLLLDQISKQIVFLLRPSLDLKLLAFNFVKNTGAVWGFFQDSNIFLIWVSVIAIGVLIYFYDEIPVKARFFYLLLISGVVGNFIDRVVRGFVVDFIDFKFWPVFNFADAFITIGVIGLVYFVWKN